MRRVVVLLTVVALGLGVSAGSFVLAMDLASPIAEGAIPSDSDGCATPVAAEAAAATPGTAIATVESPRDRGASGPPVDRDPCATPVSTRQTDHAAMEDGTSAVVDVQFVDMAFVPAELTIPADTDVTFRFTNLGVATHNFTLVGYEGEISGYLGPGMTSEAIVNLPAGAYAFVCTIPGHAVSGMVGTLTVE